MRSVVLPSAATVTATVGCVVTPGTPIAVASIVWAAPVSLVAAAFAGSKVASVSRAAR